MKSLAKTKAASIISLLKQQPTGILLSQKFTPNTIINNTTTSIINNHANYSSTTNSLVVKKNNIVEQEKQHNNIRHYSTITTNSVTSDQSVTSSSDIPSKFIHLDPVKYKSWTKEQVCSLLCAEESDEGAGLSIEDVKPLHDANFKGTSLANIVTDLLRQKDDSYIIDKCQKSFPEVSRDTITFIVNWVDNLLKTRLYHLWSTTQLEQQLCKPFTEGGANFEKTDLKQTLTDIKIIISKEKLQAINNINKLDLDTRFKDNLIIWLESTMIRNIEVPKEFEVHSWEDIEREFQVNDIEAQQRINTIINCITKNPKQYFTQKSQAILIREVLEPLCKYLEDCVFVFNQREKESIEIFNSVVKPFGLDNPTSKVYIYPHNTHLENSKSCENIVLDFGPTFPATKYDSREKYLAMDQTVAVFFEPPGTGKTHFAFSLTKENNHTVIPVDLIVCTNIISKLENVTTRNDMDKIVLSFAKYYKKLVKLLSDFCKKLPNVDEKQVNLYILRFLWNGGRNKIDDVYHDFGKEILNLLPDIKYKVVWFLDEAHVLGDTLKGQVPRSVSSDQYGNLITLLCSSFRRHGSMVLTTTFAHYIEGAIEKQISKDNKLPLERYSHQFEDDLPVLLVNEVETFLNFFINTKKANDDRELEIWKLVSCLIQGTFRTSNVFVESLYLCLTDHRYQKPNFTYTELIFTALEITMLKRKMVEMSQSELAEKFNVPKYKIVFHKLAIFGEVKVENDTDRSIFEFLMKRGISCTFGYENNFKVFKLTSPLEKTRLLDGLKRYYNGKDWLEQTCLYLKGLHLSFSELGTLCEITYAYLISRHFDKIKACFKGSDLEKYNLNASYHYEDALISEKSSSDVKFSTLMLKILYENRFGMNVKNNPYPLSNGEFGVQSFFSIPSEEARAEFIAILILDEKYQPSNKLPYCIPLIASVSRANDFKKMNLDFLTTDITRFYMENIETPNPNTPSSKFKQIEYEKVKNELSLLDDGMMLRIMIHPNATHNNRKEYSKNQNAPNIVKYFNGPTYAVQNKKGHFILELDSNSELVKSFEGNEAFQFPNKEL